ncbi:2-dehydro-3-deoxygalactonokinase [Novosphingobium piscinae]|uniref:2-dehydro-3-deoxygalactonokinase n=1 Tax=Novosphingobium piscinae TaxID=1507448 RepID=A0A7X1G261_9SPHN|nr:2-dehydro-3-deoxygalactonokinase [Novosphingobium piscinae]MBC2670622.1 2-dehydro-3-deoxygalactonokinase [Novosphingobium piscinae]
MTGTLIAVDWGTTNRRAYLLDAAGTVLDTQRDERGVKTMPTADYPAELIALRARYGDLPVVLAGMVGAARGWVEVPYLSCPAGLAELGAALHWIEPGRTAIVPGLTDPAGDVMRGEEVQLLGAAAAGLTPDTALLCQPGTHCKWARLEAGQVRRFATALTGELFALLQAHSLLAEFLTGAVADDAPFREGVQRGLAGHLATDLFRVRAAAVLGQRPAAQSASYTSGLLIGHDVAGAEIAHGEPVYVLADPHLGDLYARAVTMAGGTPVRIASQAAFVSGITRLWSARQP